jgi:DNA polymerase
MTSYFDMAGMIYGKDPNEIEKGTDEYMVGKVAVLGCGFGMGAKRYVETVKDWTGIEIELELGQHVIDTYREVNAAIKKLWYDLEQAAVTAVQLPGRVIPAADGRIRYRVNGPYLWCELPSGRLLCYPLPKLVEALTPWGELKEAVEVSTTNSYTRKWERRTLYGGLQTENVVQAIARDVMLDAMFRVEQEGYRTVLTVHDEILTETTSSDLESFEELMAQTPEWAPGLVVKAEGWKGPRYRKD